MRDGLDILVVSQFFAPEMGAPAARFHDFGRLLVERGHRVRVITGMPNSPSGIVPTSYRGRLRMREEIDGIEVLRGFTYASPTLSKASKSMGFATFAASAGLWSLLGGGRTDVVIATSPPPTVGIAGILAARRLRAPLVFDVRDIWPEAIVSSGRLRSKALIRALEGIERWLYRNAELVTVVTEGKRQRLLEKGLPADKVEVVPNGVDLSRFENLERDPSRLLRLGVPADRFTVLYAGIFNPPQGLDVVFDAARQLREATPSGAQRPHFVLVGAGSERRRLEARRESEDLGDWVSLLPEQPRNEIPGLLLAADANLVCLRPRKDRHTVPSKLYESLASGRPVLVSADGAPAEILRESGAGLASAAGDATALAEAVALLASNPTACQGMGESGRRFAAQSDRRALVERFEALLTSLVRRPRH